MRGRTIHMGDNFYDLAKRKTCSSAERRIDFDMFLHIYYLYLGYEYSDNLQSIPHHLKDLINQPAALNETQKNIIEGVLTFIFDDIFSSLSLSQAIYHGFCGRTSKIA